jgi:NAD(P)-dependent dehydrogenase (short-subunit alcohol dehydrogenase family)
MNDDGERLPVAVVVGVGPGNGQALGARFAREGYSVALLARDREKLLTIAEDMPHARAYSCDVTDAASVRETFEAIRQELGDVDVLLYNAGSGVFADFDEATPEQFENSWRVNAMGAFLCAKQVVPGMARRGGGSIVFTGATASLRGNVKTAAFAPAKAAQRSLAESMARLLWPKGIHVALMIVDGMVEKPGIEKFMKDRPMEALIDPAALAETAFQLCSQSRRGWSFQVEVRPALENW